jgi:hypothetical protein
MPPNGSDEEVFTVKELTENIYRVKSNILNLFFFYFHCLFVGGKIYEMEFLTFSKVSFPELLKNNFFFSILDEVLNV